MKRESLLFLCHRIPYPPDKGDKIRSYHLLRHLSQHFDVFLATFVDDPSDWRWVPEVKQLCRDSLFIDLPPRRARLRSLWGLLRGSALSLPYYYSAELERWLQTLLGRQRIDHLLVYSSPMAQYGLVPGTGFSTRVIDFVDVDSDKWRQYADQHAWPLKWLYRREWSRLLEFERSVAIEFDASVFVSAAEAKLFRELAPEAAHKVGHYNNGVDTEYFRPRPDINNPFPGGIRPLVFTGAMDYWPNIDAVSWFAREVMPSLLALDPSARFYIVGSKPAPAVRQLAAAPGIVVTGRVPDVRPYLQYARAVVAPMRIARGVQNKILEAMAMSRPVLASTRGLEGIDAEDGRQVLLADSVDDYLRYYRELLLGHHGDLGPAARGKVMKQFDWDHNLASVLRLLAPEGTLVMEGLRA